MDVDGIKPKFIFNIYDAPRLGEHEDKKNNGP